MPILPHRRSALRLHAAALCAPLTGSPQAQAPVPTVAKLGQFALIPEIRHRPPMQRMVLMKGAPPPVRAFHDHLATPKAQAAMVRCGVVVPQD